MCVWSGLVAAADVVMAVDGARISFPGSRTRPAAADPAAADYYAAGKWQHGFADVLGSVADIQKQENRRQPPRMTTCNKVIFGTGLVVRNAAGDTVHSPYFRAYHPMAKPGETVAAGRLDVGICA